MVAWKVAIAEATLEEKGGVVADGLAGHFSS
jgi:hypothetical protein